jgi:transcriptional regulator with XRE-family HTH domain
MNTAARIRGYRVRAGKSQAEMAKLLDINPAWYCDLEQRDGELASTLTLFQAIQLASLLGVRLHDIMGEEPPPELTIPLTELPAHIKNHTSRAGTTLDAFEERVGWKLGEFMDAPLQCAAELPLAFFQAIAHELGIDWLSLVPDDEPE